jgi:flagellar basal body rod protein FlgC
MTISAVNAGMLGLQRSFQNVDTATSNIARQTSGSAANGAAGMGKGLPQEMVNLHVGQRSAEASVSALRVADETLGTIIDLFV